MYRSPSGDAFLGALAHLVASGRSLAEALPGAVHVASISVQRRGAQASYPTAKELPAGLLGTPAAPPAPPAAAGLPAAPKPDAASAAAKVVDELVKSNQVPHALPSHCPRSPPSGAVAVAAAPAVAVARCRCPSRPPGLHPTSLQSPPPLSRPPPESGRWSAWAPAPRSTRCSRGWRSYCRAVLSRTSRLCRPQSRPSVSVNVLG